MFVCMYVCIWMFVCVFVCLCLYVCVYLCVYICVFMFECVFVRVRTQEQPLVNYMTGITSQTNPLRKSEHIDLLHHNKKDK